MNILHSNIVIQGELIHEISSSTTKGTWKDSCKTTKSGVSYAEN